MKSLVLLAVFVSLAAAAEPPAWFRELATAAHPVYPPQTNAVVLLHEEKIVIHATGKQTTTTRQLIKILTLEGKPYARASLFFDAKDSRVRDVKAWVLQPSGKTRELGKKDFSEDSVNDFELYSSYRYFTAHASSEIDPQGVFGFEATLEEKTVFGQFSFSFQNAQPHLLSRFQLTVPAGWTAEAKAHHGGPSQPVIDGSTYTWETRKLGFVEREPSAPRLSSLVPRIRVTLLPPAGQSSGALTSLGSWTDVSQWNTRLTDPCSELTPALEAKAQSLIAGKPDPADRLRAIAEFAQSIRYVAISTNISKGGGYVPHPADRVLRTAYGDCKDKANLMKTLLKAVGIPSWMVAIYSGDPRYTQPDWPSPQQFNHAIIAVSVPANTQAPAALTHPTLGRLLLFDPTDTTVPFDYLPDHEQGAHALLLADEKGTLIQAPETAPRLNHTDRHWTITLLPDGALTGRLEEVSTGQEAFDAAENQKRLSKDQLEKQIQARMSRAIPGVELADVTYSYDAPTKTYHLALQFKAPVYPRIMQRKLWMVRGTPMAFYGVPNLNKPSRDQPLVLTPLSFSESVIWNLPPNLKLDELPTLAVFSTAYAKFSTEWKSSPGRVEVLRALEVQSQVVPAENYKIARDFFSRFHGAEAAPFVLLAP